MSTAHSFAYLRPATGGGRSRRCYLVVAVFTGGWTIAFRDGEWQVAGTGLVALLAVIAMVITLFRGRYPDQLFDFIMGMNRWCFRVLADTALMRDEYPPFRFEPGGPDPAGTAPTVSPPLAPTGPRQPPASRVGTFEGSSWPSPPTAPRGSSAPHPHLRHRRDGRRHCSSLRSVQLPSWSAETAPWLGSSSGSRSSPR